MTIGRRLAIAGLAGGIGVLAGYAARALTPPPVEAVHLAPERARPAGAAEAPAPAPGPDTAAGRRADPTRPTIPRAASRELVPRTVLARDRVAGYATMAAAQALHALVLKRLVGDVEGEYLLRACLERAGEDTSDDLRLELDVRTRRDRVELLHVEMLDPPASPAVDACVATLVGTSVTVPRTAAEAPYLEREGTLTVHTSLDGW